MEFAPAHLELNRRRLFKLGVSSIVTASLASRLLHAQSEQQSCSSPSRRTMRHPMVVLARIQFPGSTRMAITTRARWRMSNYRTFITSKESWRAVTAFTHGDR
jgi:hypothetical protein